MKLRFLELPDSERRLHIEQAAIQRKPVAGDSGKGFLGELVAGGSVQFRVCRIAGVQRRNIALQSVRRDRSFLRRHRFVGFAGVPESAGGGHKPQSGQQMDDQSGGGLCRKRWRKQIAPASGSWPLQQYLGKRDDGWFEFQTDAATNSPVLLFHYPSTLPSGFEYFKRSVKLEFGSLTDQQPIGRHAIQSLMATIVPAAFADWRCEVVALEFERSFWEKATILHKEYHRPAERPMPDRFSRHYADTAALARHPAAVAAIGSHEFRERVVAWKGKFFGSSWANYDLAKPGTFRLVPSAERLPAFQRDYDAMRDMYLSQPVRFDEILAVLAELERRINGDTE